MSAISAATTSNVCASEVVIPTSVMVAGSWVLVGSKDAPALDVESAPVRAYFASIMRQRLGRRVASVKLVGWDRYQSAITNARI